MESVVAGRVKWFDDAKGFGFLVCDGFDTDVLVHKSVLREHGLKSLPEDAACMVEVTQGERGLHAARVEGIDLRDAKPPRIRLEHSNRSSARHGPPGDWGPATVRWFKPERGYGFAESPDGTDVFLHAAALRRADIVDIRAGEPIEIRIATGDKGLLAAEVRRLGSAGE